MKRRNATRSALFTSIISLLLCVSMLVGTTFAWFTDSVVSGNNVIAAGNLDVELYHSDKNDSDYVDSSTKLFNDVTLWEPGVVVYENFRVENVGSLALKYQLSINATPVGEKDLTKVLKVAVVDGGFNGGRADAHKLAEEGKMTSLSSFALSGELEGNEKSDTYGIVIYWEPGVNDNESNMNTANKGKVLSVDLGINLFATQEMYENDSFGPDYDLNAPIVSAPVDLPEAPVTLKGDNDVTIGLTQELLDELEAAGNVEKISIAVSEPVVDATNNSITFDSVELVDQNGNVIDLESLDLNNPLPISLPLPANAPFAEGDTVIVYHDGEYMASATVTDGKISYTAAHLCEITLGAVEAPKVDEGSDTVEIGTAAELFGFAQMVNSGKNYYAGKTIVLTADIDLKNAEWTPIGSAAQDHGFMGNFDGKGYTISNLTMNNLQKDTDGYVYAGLFGVTEGSEGAENVIQNLKIQNVTINTTGHIVSAAIAYPYYTTVKNVTVCGDIAITGGNYTAGVLAYTRRCTTASGLTISGNEASYIKGAITVGGVISDIQTNGGIVANYTKFSASGLTISGNKCVGGISGIIGGQTLNDATVKNVTLKCSDKHVGIVAGAIDSNPVINNVTVSNVEGTTSVVGAPFSTESSGYVTVDGVLCVANAATFKEQLATGKVVLASNITLNENVTVTDNVEIDLNGSTIYATLSGTGNQDLFLVKGNLTMKNGSVELTATQNQGWGAMSAIFDITAGGVVNLENVVADNKGGTDMNFVAHLNNWGEASLNVNDSTLKATYVAVRVFNSGYDMNNVSIKNSTLSTTGNAAFWVHNYTAADFGTQEKADAQAKLLNFTFENVKFEAKKAAFRYGFTNAEYNTADGAQVVSTADELVAALEAKQDVIFANDIKIDPANMSNAYGKTGINVKYGQTIDGNGYTLNIQGAGGTWDSGINTTGGLIKNITVTGSFRGIFINHTSEHSEKVVLENVVIGGNGTVYTISCDQGLNQGIEATNCTFNGWTSFAKTAGEAKFVDCSFGEGSGYAYCRPYCSTEFVNCTFSEGYAVDTTQATVTFTDCTAPN